MTPTLTTQQVYAQVTLLRDLCHRKTVFEAALAEMRRDGKGQKDDKNEKDVKARIPCVPS
jgi:hypothetical protein